MEIFVIVLALAFLQVWGSRNPFHQDAWLSKWAALLARFKLSSVELVNFFVIAVPLALIALLIELLLSRSAWLMLPVAVVVLLYSFGRGEFFEIVREYTQACYVEDWESASARAMRFDVNMDNVETDDWATLHRHVFDQACYRGFERMFAVLFWFFILGPIGALMYRLVFIRSHAETEDVLAKRWLWILEWPAARTLGLSFALTGNFSGCIQHWRDCFLCAKRSTVSVLSPMILGALSVSDEMQPDCEVTRKELTMMSKLFQRTLWFWVGVASAITIFL